MRSPSDWGALGAFVNLGWRLAAAQRLATAARGALNVLILAIFWALWQATPLSELRRPNFTPERLIWYLAITEWIVFATGMPYREIEEDIRNGTLSTSLSRPIGYAASRLAQWSGAVAYRLPAFGAIGFGAALAFSATVPLAPAMLVTCLVSAVLAVTILHLCNLMIGLVTAWTGSAAPLHWIWQKALFVLGGLIIPLTLYPPPLRGLAESSPFAAMLSAPASLALDPSAGHATRVLMLQSAWLVALAALAWLVERAAIARLVARGI